jgi:hypothetical protein
MNISSMLVAKYPKTLGVWSIEVVPTRFPVFTRTELCSYMRTGSAKPMPVAGVGTMAKSSRVGTATH